MVWTARARGGTSRSHTSNIVLAKLAERVWCTKFQSSLLDIYFRFSGFQPSLFTSATGRIGVHTAPKYGKKPIRDRRGAASPRYRSLAATTAFMCEQKPYLVWFSWRRKRHPVCTRCGHTLRRAVTANKCTQKAWCTCRIVVLVIKPFEAPVAVAVVVAEPFKSH